MAMNQGLFKTAVTDLGRLGKITSVFIRHGFGHLVHQLGLTPELPSGKSPEELAADPSGTATRLRAACEELGTTFVKLAQILSTRPDLLPPAFIREFSKLQDDVPPLPFDIIEQQIADSLPLPIDQIFANISPSPLATGSIAQTHLATLLDGSQVVIKVQRPNIEPLIRSDLDLLRLFARMLEATIHEVGLYSPSAIIEEFERALRMEMDFTIERHHLHLFRELYQDNPQIWIPKPVDACSSRTLLVLEFIPGCKITDLPPNSERAQNVTLLLIDLLYTMLFEHGVFHADPHPGNILITADNRIGLIDFGLIGRLTQRQQDTLISLIISVVSGDVDGIARAVLSLGRPEARIPIRDFREDIINIRAQYLQGTLGDIDLSMFVLQLIEAGQRYRIKVPAEWALLSKATVSIEGIVRFLHPHLNLPDILRPYARKLLLNRYGPQRFAQSMLSGTLSLSGLLRELPSQFNQILMDLEYGGLRVKAENHGLDHLQDSLQRLGTRLILALLASALVISLFIVLAPVIQRTLWGWPILAVVATIPLMLILLTIWHGIAAEQGGRKIHIRKLLRWLQRLKSR